MLNSRSLKIAAVCLASMLPVLSPGQTKLSHPEVNPPAMDSGECAKNPELPNCAGMQERTAPTRITPGQLQPNETEDRQFGASQERSQAQLFRLPVKEEPTEFQIFVATSVDRELPLFGYNLFEQVPSTFAPADRVPVTADYVIGPGDELLIRAWGQIDLDARVTVDRGGTIYLPRVGSIAVSGLQYRQLPDFLKTTIGRVFRNFDLTVSLGRLRSIQIFVVGQARRPGAYTISSLSTLVNALFASGGPSNRGSMRHIQLKRGAEVITEFDLYDLLIKGDKSKDVVLQPGDVIYIPPVGPQVAVFGSVNTPAIYELASTATLKAQIEIAGGLTNTADGSKVIVERIEGRTIRKVDQFDLDEKGMGREVRDGDLIRVFPITPRFDNAVTLRGNVAQPGRYPWRSGMRVRDLVPTREFLLTRDFWEQQNRLVAEKKFGNRESETDEFGARDQKPSQRNTKTKNRELANPQQVQRKVPANQAEGQSDDEAEKRFRTEELKNDVKRNAPEINWEYAVIQRLDPVSLNTTLIPFNLGQAILEGSEAENKILQPGDIVTIFSQADIAVGIEKQSKFIRLEGEIKSPGIYKVEPGETLRDVVLRAGGLTANAYLFGAEFTRDAVKRDQQRTLNEMIRELEQETERKTSIAQSRPEQQQNTVAQMEADKSYIEKLRTVSPTGRVVLELKPTQSSVSDIPSIAIEDGDRLVVPHKPSTVTVMGAVYTQSSFVFQDNTPMRRYLNLAGNPTRMADKKHIFLVRADGSVVSREQVGSRWSGNGFESIRALPGDLLIVPTELDKGAFIRGLRDWSQVISNFGLGAAAIYVLTGR